MSKTDFAMQRYGGESRDLSPCLFQGKSLFLYYWGLSLMCLSPFIINLMAESGNIQHKKPF